MIFIIIALLSYLAGSFPAAYLAGRFRGIDIRKAGSGNSGATNALRVLGPRMAALVLLLDAAKGAFSVVCIAPWIMADASKTSGEALLSGQLLAGASVILGHIFPVWLGFKGGKGVATGAAVIASLAPWAALVSLVTFILIVTITRFVSLASIMASIALPLAYPLLYHGASFHTQTFAFCMASSLLVIVMHRRNIGRLLQGSEPRI